MLRLMSALALVLLVQVAGAAEQRTRRVIILVMDGPRRSETWDDPAKSHIPHIANELAPQGVVLSDFRNDGPTYTNAGHTALTTGVYQEIDNSGKELPREAGLPQRWLKRSGAPAEDAWIVASKDKLAILGDCQDPEWHGVFRPSIDCGMSGSLGSGYRDDALTYAHLIAILDRHHPHIVIVNFKEPDAAGHANDWRAYLKGIDEGDARVAQLWTWLQAHPPFAGETALFVTNDHGRHLDGVADGFISHGDDCEGCRRIMLLGLGPDFARGVVSDHRRGQIDVAATAAALLGVPWPAGHGSVIDELFPH